MTGIIVFIVFSVALLFLIRQRLLNIDLSFPWFMSLVILTYLSSSDNFIIYTADLFGIKYPPIVIILITLFIFLGLITILSIYISELRRRQVRIVRKLVVNELLQEQCIRKINKINWIIKNGVDHYLFQKILWCLNSTLFRYN